MSLAWVSFRVGIDGNEAAYAAVRGPRSWHVFGTGWPLTYGCLPFTYLGQMATGQGPHSGNRLRGNKTVAFPWRFSCRSVRHDSHLLSVKQSPVLATCNVRLKCQTSCFTAQGAASSTTVVTTVMFWQQLWYISTFMTLCEHFKVLWHCIN
jgi:hypothetical protein